jgi:DNA-binding response OmpR family regulator
MKILVTEDDEVLRTILCRALHQLGHQATSAADGEIALAALDREPVNIVISDWIMPRVDGLELCRRIRARPQTDYVYFILLTVQDATVDNQRLGADAGVDDFLTKPLDRSNLWLRVRVAERILQFTSQIRRLEALLPICQYCRKIRDDHNYWQQIETYVVEHTGSQFSHSICPDCYQRVVIPQLAALKRPPP